MGLQIEQKVEKLNGKELSYSDFVEKYLVQNQPVILTGLMEDWRACKDWVSNDGEPNFDFLSTHFGKSKVQVIFFPLLLKFQDFIKKLCHKLRAVFD